MFRIKFLKYIAQKKFTDMLINNNTITRNSYLFGCQNVTNINLLHTLKHPRLKSEEIHHEETINKSPETIVSDKEYIVRLKNDPDKFGPPQEKQVIDEGDIEEEKYFTDQPSPSQKLRTKQYADIIKNLIRQRKIKEAIDVVEVRMLKEDRVKPENYLYNLLLGACGRVGYTKKAFKLYNLMKKRGLQVTGGTYTALFNACANSPWPTTDGLTRANHLRNIMIEKGYEPNDTNYNVMIKAFGRCGDLSTAFSLVDEMCTKGFKINNDTINFLLQACISDEEAGFRHALLVWRKLVNKGISPNVYTYNLMLRCIRDCGLGDIEVTRDVINKIVSGDEFLLTTEKGDQKLLSVESQTSDNENMYKSVDSCQELPINNENISGNINPPCDVIQETTQPDIVKSPEVKDIRPNLMAPVPHLGSLISLSEVKKPEERLLLVGGCSGFLENMQQNNCVPDIKTCTQLLDNIPGTLAAEQELMAAMKKLNVKLDIDFFNMLIRKRSLRHDFENAKAVLNIMKKRKYLPNLITYGVLALSCRNKEEALELIYEMESKSYQLNIEILGAMLHQACYHVNFGYVLEVMEICVRENIQPTKKFMTTLNNFIKKCKDSFYLKEMTKSQEKKFGILRARYKTWVQEIQIDESEDAHPWEQYKEANGQNASHYKWKDGARFKPRHTSLFRVKTSAKHMK